ncbi:MAG: hypothetical protein RI958_461 [Actinomycetota bacterium]
MRRRLVVGVSLAAVLASGVPVGLADAGTQSLPPAEELAAHEDGRLIVAFRDGTDIFTEARTFNRRGVRRGDRIGPRSARTEVVTLPAGMSVEEAMVSFKSDPSVRFAEPDYLVQKEATSNDALFGSLWGMQGDASSPANQFGSGAAEAWAQEQIGTGDIVVGIIDEGVDVNHPDLSANIWVNTAEATGVAGVDDDANGYIDDVNGWDFFYDNASVFDAGEDTHGTHVAGTIGGVGGNSIGVAGVNWSVKMIPANFLGPGGGYISDAINALDYLTALKVNKGVNVVAVNNSWGGGGYSAGMADAINRAGDAGILFVAAAGNSAYDNDLTANYPSNYDCSRGNTRSDCVMAVAAIGSDGSLASFSQWGATTVDLGAPGVNITSTLPNNTYGAYNGTSMATPHVTGAAALCASMQPTLSAEEIRNAITASAAPTASLAGKTATGGRLDIGAMMSYCLTTPVPVTGTVTGLTAAAASTTAVTVSWTDGATGESRFEVERAGADCATFARVGTASANATSYTVSGLAPSTEYCFRVRGASGAGQTLTATDWSNTANATTLAPPPGFTCAATTYAWVDPTGGVSYTLGDDASIAITSPFGFDMYGTSVTAMTVSSNGFVRMGGGAATTWTNTTIPAASDPNHIVAPWWDDLVPPAGGVRVRSLGTAPNRQLAITWQNVVHFGTTNGVTFQAVFREATQDVLFQYQDATTGVTPSNGGGGATIGIEDSAGTYGTLVSFNSATRTDLSALRCTMPRALAIATSTLAAGTTGTAYSQTLEAGGGSGPYTWSIADPNTLPAGLSLSSAGVLSGVPTAAGTSTFTVQVDDTAGGTATAQLSVTVAAPVTVDAVTLPGGTTNTAYVATSITAAGGTGTYTYSRTAGTLPAGLTLSAAGLLSGTPTAAGTSTFTVQALDGAGRTGTRQFSVTVVAGVSITTATLPAGNVGVAYANTQVAASGGTTPYTWSIASGALPAGLSISAGGLVSGTPTAAGSSTVTLRVTDSASRTATRAYTISVTAAALPGTFNKTAPTNGQTNRVRTNLAISWGASAGAVRYEYCVDTTNNAACDGTWVNVGTARTATLTGLLGRTVYYWQVRSVNAGGTRLANNGTWWRFTTRA